MHLGELPEGPSARPAPPVFTARNSVGKTMIGARNCGRRKACLTERVPERGDHARLAREPRASGGAAASGARAETGSSRLRCSSSDPSRWRPVLSTNTSSSVG